MEDDDLLDTYVDEPFETDDHEVDLQSEASNWTIFGNKEDNITGVNVAETGDVDNNRSRKSGFPCSLCTKKQLFATLFDLHVHMFDMHCKNSNLFANSVGFLARTSLENYMIKCVCLCLKQRSIISCP